MPTLVLMRHSKAVAADGRPDRDRPLAPGRGPTEAAQAGAALVDAGRPDIVLVSDARRTVETFAAVAAVFGETLAHRLEPRLYGADPSAILALLGELPPDCRRVLVVGHNPGLGDLARMLAKTGERRALRALAAHFPTSAFAVLRFGGEASEASTGQPWARLARGAVLERFFSIESATP